MAEENLDFFKEFIIIHRNNQQAVRDGLFMDSDRDSDKKKNKGPSFENVLRKYFKTEKGQEKRRKKGKLSDNEIFREVEELTAIDDLYAEGVWGDVTGEGFICDICEFGLKTSPNYKETEDLVVLLQYLGFTVSNFLNCPRLQRGMYKALRQSAPDKVSGREDFDRLIAELEENHDKRADEVASLIAEERSDPVQMISEEELSPVMNQNEQILNLARELGECAALVLTDLDEGMNVEDIEATLAVKAGDTNQKGAQIRYCEGRYELLQFVYGYSDADDLCTTVAEFSTPEEAEEAGRLLFEHAPFEEMTMRIPLSAGSYAEAVYPFRDFKICGPEGADEKPDESQQARFEEIVNFFDGLSEESREELRDI